MKLRGPRYRKCVALVAVGVWSISTVASASGDIAPEQSFRNCRQLRVKYALGVAATQRAAGPYPAEVSAAVYRVNNRFDADRDGIACEDEQLQRNLNGTAPATTAPTAVVTPPRATPSAAALPSNSDIPLSTQKVVLARGATYNFYSCTTGAHFDATLEVLSIATAWTFKARARGFLDTGLCRSPGYPFKLVLTWNVTERPGEVSALRVVGFARSINIPVEIVG